MCGDNEKMLNTPTWVGACRTACDKARTTVRSLGCNPSVDNVFRVKVSGIQGVLQIVLVVLIASCPSAQTPSASFRTIHLRLKLKHVHEGKALQDKG